MRAADDGPPTSPRRLIASRSRFTFASSTPCRPSQLGSTGGRCATGPPGWPRCGWRPGLIHGRRIRGWWLVAQPLDNRATGCGDPSDVPPILLAAAVELHPENGRNLKLETWNTNPYSQIKSIEPTRNKPILMIELMLKNAMFTRVRSSGLTSRCS